MSEQRRPGRYPDELRERAVRMVLEAQRDCGSEFTGPPSHLLGKGFPDIAPIVQEPMDYGIGSLFARQTLHEHDRRHYGRPSPLLLQDAERGDRSVVSFS